MKKKISKLIVITAIIEIFLFNFDFIKSFFYKETVIDKDELILNEVHQNKSRKVYTNANDQSYIEIEINKKTKNLYLDIEGIGKEAIKLELDYTDDANKNYNKYESRREPITYEIIKNIEKSKYIDCNHLGKTGNIKLKIDSNTGYKINEIAINKRVEPYINIIRLILVFGILIFLNYYLKSKTLKEWIDKNEKKCFWIIVIIFCSILSILYLNYSELSVRYIDHYTTTYQEALMNGKLELELKNISFEEVENIYDYSQRQSYQVPWDVSYYNEKFYMYFGVLPTLIMGLFHLKTHQTAMIFSIISAIFFALLIKKIIEHYTPKCSPKLKLLMIVFALFNSRLLLLIPRTRYYELIIICGFCFSVIGLYFYLLFKENKKIRYLFLGSLGLCLAVTCRSGMLLISLIGLLLIIKDLNNKNFIYYFTPYIIIGSILMYMNYIRFGNIFDFGIKYQLTVIDHHYLKLDINNIINGIYTYLFKMPNFIPEFPYITNNISMINYNGFYFNTSTGNGLLPMSMLGLVLPFVYKKIDKKTLKLIISCLIIGLLIMTLNNCFGGAVRRYTLEFSWLFIIPMILLTIKWLSTQKKTILILVIMSCIMNFLIIFDNKNDDLGSIEESKFRYNIQYLIEP